MPAWLFVVLLVVLSVHPAQPRTCGIDDIFENLSEEETDWSTVIDQYSGFPQDCETLAIQDISFGDVGAAGVAAALTRTPIPNDLRNVYLNYNSIGAVGAAAIADALLSPAAAGVVRLHMLGNNIGANGAAAIAKLFIEQYDGILCGKIWHRSVAARCWVWVHAPLTYLPTAYPVCPPACLFCVQIC